MKNIYYNNTQRYFCITTPIILNCEVIGFLARNLPDATFKQLNIHPTTVKKALEYLTVVKF